jgi:prolyl-tRNA synthetase
MQPCINRLSRNLFKTTNDKDLLVKAGMVQKHSAGLYSLLPLGFRVLTKLENLIRNEFQFSACEMKMNLLLTDRLWKITERLNNAELFKFDNYLLAPTHEEEVTHIVGNIAQSHKELPLRVFQIGAKFRNEKRPRMGLLRAREFIMKDLYSFDQTRAAALNTFEDMNNSYARIFDRLGVPYVKVEADSGSIGGDMSNEYHLISEFGEDSIIICKCGYSANLEKGTSKTSASAISHQELQQSDFQNTVQMVQNVPSIKCLQVQAGSKSILLAIPNSHDLNELKLNKLIGPFKVLKEVSDTVHSLIIDESLTNYSAAPSNPLIKLADIVNVKDGDNCRKCGGTLATKNAIEIAHTFYLGTKYSKVLDSKFKTNQNMQAFYEMGCYGIGISRLISAIPLVSSDPHGIIWPEAIAPYQICAILITTGNAEETIQLESKCIAFFQQSRRTHVENNDFILDDRPIGFSAKFKDALLVGYPKILVFGKDFLNHDLVEVHDRRTATKVKLRIDSVDLLNLLGS